MASEGAVSVPFRLDVLTLKPFFNADDEVAGGSGLFAAVCLLPTVRRRKPL
jgi:hypothetical protein